MAIPIYVTTGDLSELGFFLHCLARLQEEQRAAAARKREAARKPRLLALPKPEATP